jgi:putative peptidoglycan lipid II flippase
VTHPTNAETISAAQITVLGLGTTLGIIIQAAGLLPALRRVGFRWRLRWDWRALGLSQLGRLGAWMLIYVIVSQIAVFVINKLAYSAANTAAAEGHGAPGPFIFNNAYLIFMMAHGVVAVSIITVLMPRMSAAAAENRHADLAYQISLGTRLVAVILIPVTAAYLVLGRPLAVTLFQWGNYHHAQALNTGWVIAVGGLGLVPFAISQVQLFAFYAMADTKTPALINVPVVALRIVVDLLFFVALPALWVATGLMGGNAISFVLGVVLGYMWLRRYVGDLGLRQVFGTMSKLAVAAAVAALPALLVVVVLVNVWNDGKIASIVELIAGSIVLAVVYIVVALALRVREVRELGTMLKARLGR